MPVLPASTYADSFFPALDDDQPDLFTPVDGWSEGWSDLSHYDA